MLTDEELAALRLMQSSVTMSRTAHRALTKLLDREHWLASKEFRDQLARTIDGSAKAVIVQKGGSGLIATNDCAKEIGRNSAQTVLFMLDGDLT